MDAATEVKNSLVILGFEEYMIRELTELFRLAYDENEAMRAFSWSEQRIQEMIAHAVFNSEKVGGFACVDMEKKQIVGALVVTKSGVSFSDEPIASDVLSYIRKEHRTDDTLSILVTAYEKWAKRAGVKKIFLVSSELNGGHELAGWSPIGKRLMLEFK